MKKINQRGFSPIAILLVLILVVLVGFTGYYVYNAQKKTASVSNEATNNPQKTTPQTTTVDTGKYVTAAGITYIVPANWTSVETMINNKQGVELKTADLKTTTNKLGATLVDAGAKSSIYVDDLNGKKLADYYNQGFVETILSNKNIIVNDVTYGQNKGVQFTYSYEGSTTTSTYLLLGEDKVIVANYTSKDNSLTDSLFAQYSEILNSVK